jgi:peptide deformylase
MARLDLVYYPDAILKTRCADITTISQETVDLVRDMAETMYLSQGIGLAAPQIAQNIRLITVDVRPDEGGKHLMHLINPVIVEYHGRTSYEEGCLSFPGITAEVKRRDQIHVQAYDVAGRELDFDADGLLSICIQHELDHLNGVTFVDRLTPIQKKLVLREYKRLREESRLDDDDAVLRSIQEGR